MSLDVMIVASNVGIVLVTVVAILADHHTMNLFIRLFGKVRRHGRKIEARTRPVVNVQRPTHGDAGRPEEPAANDRIAADIGGASDGEFEWGQGE